MASRNTTTILTGEVVETFNALASLGKVPAGLVALKLARIIAALRPEAQTVAEEEQRLLEEYAQVDEDGHPKVQHSEKGVSVLLDPARRSEFAAKRRELRAELVEIRAPKITAAEMEQLNRKMALDVNLIQYIWPFVDGEPGSDTGSGGEHDDERE